jgi:hypothetical protein
MFRTTQGSTRSLPALAAGLACVAAWLCVPSGAEGHATTAVQPAAAMLGPASCAGAPIEPTQVITGEFSAEQQGSFVLLPFDVPAGTTAVRVKYCWDPPIGPFTRHTLDLGLYEARDYPGELYGEDEFRGWGGSSHPDVIVSNEGFKSEAAYVASPRTNEPGKTTRGFIPGPIKPGEWAVELGLASIVPRSLGDTDGKVGWRVEIQLSNDPAYADEPYQPALYDTTPASTQSGWYAGDFHVHAEHSALGDATMTETFGFAFKPIAQAGAGLDFITLSDYVVPTAWGEIGRYQPDFPGKLVARSSEIITYRGHTNNHVSATYVDYRTGPIFEREHDGSLVPKRAPRPPRELFDEVHAGGGFTQINHPTIFPSGDPFFQSFCRGCPWDYTDEETQYSSVDAIEVSTGPPPPTNPFTRQAIEFWERALGLGHKIAAVGSSDSHNAGRAAGFLSPQAPVGTATTVVFADELSEAGIRRGVQARHTYVKLVGNKGPDVRLTANVPVKKGDSGIIGDVVQGNSADFTARVTGGLDPSNPDPLLLKVVKDGVTFHTETVTSNDHVLRFHASEHGRYRLQLERGPAIEVVSSPIWFESLPTRSGKGCGDRNHAHDRAAECNK